MACLAAIVLIIAADLTPASGSVIPACDQTAPRFEDPRFAHPLCAERIIDGLGPIIDMAVADSGDVHVLSEDGTITAVRSGSDPATAAAHHPGARILEAGYRSLLVGTGDGVTRHRFSWGELLAESDGHRIFAERPSTLALARLGRLFVATSSTECEAACTEVRVFDALDSSPSTGRAVFRTGSEIRALAALPGADVMFALMISTGGAIELTSVGDHRGGCRADDCTSIGIPAGDATGMAMVADAGTGHPTALVAAGPEVWSVTIDDGVPVSVQLMTESPGASFRVTSGPDGEVYLADAAAGVVWRLWGES